jgi:multidrug resistance efflux pump
MNPPDRQIPIPFKRRMQNLRSKVVPLLVFGVAVMVTAMLWHDAISPAMLVAEVAAVKASVSSPVAATVERMHAQRLQLVKAGDLIAELRPNDPRQALDVIQGKLGSLRLRAGASDAEQNANANQRRETLDFERLRLDWLVEKVKLATAVAKARKAAMDLELAQGMDSAPASAKRYMQAAELVKQSADAEVTERGTLVDSLGLHIKEIGAAMTSAPAAKDNRLTGEIDSLEERIAAIENGQSVIMLYAPMTGMVNDVLRCVGENVVGGEALVTIIATQPEHIVGFMRQPFPLEPAVGQQVEVRTHDRARLHGLAAITGVGATFEPIPNAALHPAATPEVGLRFEVSLPPDLRLRPGELVSLVIRPLVKNKPAL